MAIFSSKDLPNVRPVADFNFAATKVLDNRINFSRGSIGTYIDNMGVVRYAPHNVPRFDHDPTTGESLGLLIEESRTNLFQNSTLYEESNLNGFYQSAAIEQQSEVGPDGKTGDVSLYHPNSIQNTHYYYANYLSQTGAHTISAWFKNLETTIYYPQLRIFNVGSGQAFANFNITGDGAVYSTGGNSFTSASIEKYPNGWYKCMMSCSNVNAHTMGIVASNSTSAELPNYAGSVDSNKGFLVWGVQVEASSFATSLIPTNGTTVTRGADQAVVKGEKFKKIFDTGFSSFSALIDYDNLSTDDGDNHGIFAMWGEETNYDNRIELFKSSSSPYHIMTRADGGGGKVFADATPVGSDKSAVQKIAFSWSVPDYSNTTSRRWAMSFSGEDVDEIADSTGTSTPALTRLGIGINPTRLDLEAGLTHYKRVAIYNTVLTDEELKGLSAI